MVPNFIEVSLDSVQASLIEDAAKIQDLGAKQIKALQKQLFALEQKLRKKQQKTVLLDAEIKETQQQINNLAGTQSTYENAVNVLMKSLKIEPPYKITFVYNNGKPVAVRLPNDSLKTTVINNS